MSDEVEHSPPDAADATAPPAPVGVGRAFARNVGFLAVGAIVARFTGLIAQLVLGRKLTDEQFGVFGIALGFTILTNCLRGGEVHHYLQTIAPDRFNRDAAPFVRVAFLASMVGTLATILAAVAAGFFRSEEMLPAVLIVLALHAGTPFLNAPLRARMQVDGRFGLLTAVDTTNSILRIFVVIAFAYGGAGPITLAVQLLVSALFEAVVLWWITRVPVFGMLRGRGGEREALHTVKWTVLAGIFTTAVLQGDYFAASLFAPAAAVGVYYFIFGLCNQSAYLAATMLREAVGPAIARVREDPERRTSAAIRIARGLAVLVPCVVFAVPVVFPELDLAVWNGRWGEWKWVAMVLSAHVCFLIMTTLLYGTLQGMRDYKTPARLEIARAIGIVGGAGIGAAISPTPMSIAIGVLAIGGVTSGSNTVRVLHRLGVGTFRAIRLAFVPTVAGAALAVLSRLFLDRYQGWSGADPKGGPVWLVELFVAGFGFLALYGVMARIFFHSVLRDMIGIAPARVAKYIRFLG
ncbi:MAG: oligosaccharide flippase family protein [Phycisphaerae bacterium]|nr:oligosaccharide flippase family protein [Phycisphaerae bacterium]